MNQTEDQNVRKMPDARDWAFVILMFLLTLNILGTTPHSAITLNYQISSAALFIFVCIRLLVRNAKSTTLIDFASILAAASMIYSVISFILLLVA